MDKARLDQLLEQLITIGSELEDATDAFDSQHVPQGIDRIYANASEAIGTAAGCLLAAKMRLSEPRVAVVIRPELEDGTPDEDWEP